MNKHLNNIENLLILLTKKDGSRDAETSKQVDRLAGDLSPRDWETIHSLSKIHRIITCVYYNIMEYEKSGLVFNIPENIRRDFMENIRSCMQTNRVFSEERLRLAREFHKLGVKVVFLKGMTYGKYIYKKEGYRSSKDVDILARREDLPAIHTLLHELGYKVSGHDYSQGMYPDELSNKCFDIMPYSVMEYSKPLEDGKKILIDVHKVNKYNIYNSTDLYNKAILNDDLYELDILDLFIYSCYHTYHHYGMDSNIMRTSNMPKLKLYMDVREVLLKIDKDNLIDRLRDRILEIDAAYVVNEIVKLTELIYGEVLPLISGVTDRESLMNHTSINPLLFSRYEHRLFRTQEEREKIFKYRDREEDNDGSIIEGYECKQMLNMAWYDRSSWADHTEYRSEVDSMWFGELNIFGSTTKANNGRYAVVSFAYDHRYLYVRWHMHDSVICFGDEDYYDVKQNQLELVFNNEKVRNCIYIQPKTTMNHRAYIKNGRAIDAMELKDYQIILTNMGKDEYEAYIKLSWEDIQIDKDEYKEIGFYMNVFVGREKDEMLYILTFADLHKGYISIC